MPLEGEALQRLISAPPPHRWVVRSLGRVAYAPTWQAMQEFTAARVPMVTDDEIWLLEHPPVYTLGVAGKLEHVLDAGAIPLVPIDRGGQVTYHGPGQLVAYLLIDLHRRGYGVRELVRRIEAALIDLLAGYGVIGTRRAGAPGVYVGDAKIAALGLRVRRGCTYHGLALNVDMDLEPFSRINPCGYAGLAVTQLRALGVGDTIAQVGERLVACLQSAIDAPPEVPRHA